MNDKTNVAPPSADATVNAAKPDRSFRRLAILAASNEGVDLPLKAGGTDHTLKVVSQWSDKFYLRQAELQKEAGADIDPKAVRIDLLAALIIGWDFDEELTLASAKEFLTVAPHIADFVENFTSNAGNFYRA